MNDDDEYDNDDMIMEYDIWFDTIDDMSYMSYEIWDTAVWVAIIYEVAMIIFDSSNNS